MMASSNIKDMTDRYPYIPRAGSAHLQKLFKNFSCLVLTGARQVGKSTLLEHLFPNIRSFVFDPIHDVHNAKRDPELFLSSNPPPLILDEIQYVPELIPIIKRRIDQIKKPGQYILTGSQQWGVLKQISESLAGRAIITHLDGFSLEELGRNATSKPWVERWLIEPNAFLVGPSKRLNLPFPLYEQLWRGFLPETRFLDLDLIPAFHHSYQSTYVQKDIRMLADVSDLTLFSRFIRLVAALTAQEINYSHLGREIGLTPQTAQRWLSLLDQTFEWHEIPAFSNNSIKKVSLKSKGYFSDTGQVCFSQMISSKDAIASHPLWGALFETAVVNEIKKQCLLISVPPKLYHWRAHSGAECDLILERDGKFFPIEIKAKSNPNRSDARGIGLFRQTYSHLNVQKGLVIAPIQEAFPLTENDIAMPWDIS